MSNKGFWENHVEEFKKSNSRIICNVCHHTNKVNPSYEWQMIRCKSISQINTYTYESVNYKQQCNAHYAYKLDSCKRLLVTKLNLNG